MLIAGSELDQGPRDARLNPETHLERVISEVPADEELEDRKAEATVGVEVAPSFSILGWAQERPLSEWQRGTRRRTSSQSMKVWRDAYSRTTAATPRRSFAVARLEDPLPPGPFDLVVSALAGHYLDGPTKADLFIGSLNDGCLVDAS